MAGELVVVKSVDQWQAVGLQNKLKCCIHQTNSELFSVTKTDNTKNFIWSELVVDLLASSQIWSPFLISITVEWRTGDS